MATSDADLHGNFSFEEAGGLASGRTRADRIQSRPRRR